MVVNHPDVIEAHKRPVGSDGQVVVVPRVHGQTLGLDQLTAELGQVDENLGAFAALPQVILPAATQRKVKRTLVASSAAQRRSPGSNLMVPSSAALQKVSGHMGAVAMRLTLLVWSENMWMVSFTDRSCTWTFVSAAPVTRILSPE